MSSILQKKEFCFIDYDYNSYIDIFDNINWFRLPGKGVNYQLCGHIWSREFKGCLEVEKHKGTKAENKIYLKKVSASCWRAECPVCYNKWALKSAQRIEDKFLRMPKYVNGEPLYQTGLFGEKRIGVEASAGYDLYNEMKKLRIQEEKFNAYRDYVRSKGSVDCAEDNTIFSRPIHLIVSPSKEDSYLSATKKGYKRLRYLLKKYVEKIGFWGGCSIFHPYRSDKETKPIVLDEGVAFKSVNNFNPRELQQYMKQIIGIDVNCWYISPHFHLIGYGDIDGRKVADLYSKTGWIFKNVGVRRSVLGTAFYQLTHAGVVKGTNTVNWIGGMANSQDSWINRYGYDPLDVKKRISRCPYCDSDLKKLVWMADDYPPLMNEPEGSYLIDFVTGFAEVFELNSDRAVTETSCIDGYEYAQNTSEYLVLR